MDPIRVLTVFGTRPEAIKMAPVLRALADSGAFDPRLAVTAQHREMMDQVLDIFRLKADYDLDIMRRGQSLSQIMVRALSGLEEVIKDFQPRLLLVHGDTATTFAGALAAYYHQIDIGHVEAGLRTYDKYQPFPEEMNRHLTGVLADHHFAPTEMAAENLRQEKIPAGRIQVTGNTVIDALLEVVERPHAFNSPEMREIDYEKGPVILMTAHRRENWGTPLEQICSGVLRLVEEIPLLQVVYPLHANPMLQEIVRPRLGGHPRVHLVDPLDYLDFCHLMARSTLVLTDSGGLQEEAPALNIPVLVMREKTERPEGLEAGTVRLVGTEHDRIYSEVKHLLENEKAYRAMATAPNPFGDGKAARRICRYLESFYLCT